MNEIEELIVKKKSFFAAGLEELRAAIRALFIAHILISGLIFMFLFIIPDIDIAKALFKTTFYEAIFITYFFSWTNYIMAFIFCKFKKEKDTVFFLVIALFFSTVSTFLAEIAIFRYSKMNDIYFICINIMIIITTTLVYRYYALKKMFEVDGKNVKSTLMSKVSRALLGISLSTMLILIIILPKIYPKPGVDYEGIFKGLLFSTIALLVYYFVTLMMFTRYYYKYIKKLKLKR